MPVDFCQVSVGKVAQVAHAPAQAEFSDESLFFFPEVVRADRA